MSGNSFISRRLAAVSVFIAASALTVAGTVTPALADPGPSMTANHNSANIAVKGPGNSLYLIGRTNDELGGSLYHRILGRTGGEPPKVTTASALDGFNS